MTTDTALTTSNVDPDVARALQMYERLTPLKNALGISDLSDAETQLFAMVANHTGLDPFTRQIYAIKRGGKVTHQTGIDGYRSTAEKTRQYAGSDEPTFDACNCGKAPDGHPGVARVVVRRILPNGHVVDQVGVARWHELVPPAGQDSMWVKMPFNQLAKCAEANGLRKAFPRVFGGVYIEDEMQGQLAIDGHATEIPIPPAAPVTVRDRIRARREAVEEPKAEIEPKEEAGVLSAPMSEEESAAQTGLCLSESPYGDGAVCGLAAGHERNHKSVGPDGDIQGTWE